MERLIGQPHFPAGESEARRGALAPSESGRGPRAPSRLPWKPCLPGAAGGHRFGHFPSRRFLVRSLRVPVSWELRAHFISCEQSTPPGNTGMQSSATGSLHCVPGSQGPGAAGGGSDRAARAVPSGDTAPGRVAPFGLASPRTLLFTGDRVSPDGGLRTTVPGPRAGPGSAGGGLRRPCFQQEPR